MLVRESFGGTAVEELEEVQFEVIVDWRDGWRGRVAREDCVEDCVDLGCDLWVVAVEREDGGVPVEPDDVDSRRPRGEGGRIGDTRIPESAFDPGSKSQSSSSSRSSSTESTALQKVARLDVLPPVVLDVDTGVVVTCCERRCG